ncbi:hypothetical protein RRG08_049022 [Elysia crispata]|uniref:Pre-mRNA-splicing factor 38 n=1 Tax=Elysia crispata TaxID=231223 RepID=A0AAE0ZRP7_9GAST|nr:hypothetical protein RRG08_049022 [Elysia crispata]
MCGGVRGVGAGGIVSSAYCLLFKLFTLKLTKKQLVNLITHRDSPYIRGLGFMYIRYCQPPADLWDWYEPYLDDEEELDVKAGTGHMMTIGEILRQWLVKLEWYSTLFPRIPVPIQKDLEIKFRNRPVTYNNPDQGYEDGGEPEHIPDEEVSFGEAERAAQSQRGRGGGGGVMSRDGYRNGYHRRSPPFSKSRSPRRSPPRRHISPRCSPPRGRDDFSRELENEKERQRRERVKEHKHSKHSKHRSRSRERDRKMSPSQSREKERRKSRSGSRERRRSDSKDRSHREYSSTRHRDKDSRKEQKRSKKHKHKDKERERRH